ncbi:MAG: KUP/HAK/KT family potassium transporter, partial [Gammaproteobacteria bacterium]
VVFLTVRIQEVPYVPEAEQIVITPLGHNCFQLDVNYGFKDEPDIPDVMALCRQRGMVFEMMETSFFIARQTIISTPGVGMAPWREHLFVVMS